MYIVGVVVTNESNTASYFPEARNLNGSNADICSDVAGHRVAARAICLSSQIGQIKLLILYFYYVFPPLLALLAAILDLSVATTPMLPFGACGHGQI